MNKPKEPEIDRYVRHLKEGFPNERTTTIKVGPIILGILEK